jgi:hypothetical protein
MRVLPDYQAEEIGVFLVYASRQHLDAKTRAWVDFMKAALRDAFALVRDDACTQPVDKKDNAPGKAGAWAGAATRATWRPRRRVGACPGTGGGCMSKDLLTEMERRSRILRTSVSMRRMRT